MKRTAAQKAADKKMAAFVAKDADELRDEIIAALRKDNPKITQAEIDLEISIIEGTVGF